MSVQVFAESNSSSTDFQDPLFDTGKAGPNILQIGDGIKDGTAVIVYGIAAVVQAIVPLIIYIFCAALIPSYVASRFIVYVFQAIWWPFFLTWMAVVLFDSQEFRDLMREAVHISIAGPFMLYFVGIGDLMMNAVWTDWGFWIAWLILTGYTVISLFY